VESGLTTANGRKGVAMTENETRVILKAELKHHPETSIFYEALSKAIEILEEVQQYRAIGTPEEYQAAMEKQTAKRIKQQEWMYTRCSCGHEFSKHHGDGYYSIPQEQKTKYCPDCGQKLDWSDEDGEID
jgi:hypothetical protein